MSLTTAIIQTFAETERDSFMALLKSKALQLQKIEQQLEGDVFSIPETEVKKLYQRQSIITNELNTMYGFLKVFDQLKEVYSTELEKAAGGAFDVMMQNESLKASLQTAYLFIETAQSQLYPQQKQFHISTSIKTQP